MTVTMRPRLAHAVHQLDSAASVSVGFGLRFSIPQLSPAPIALDFGFPIVEQDTDEGRLFTFSVDLPF